VFQLETIFTHMAGMRLLKPLRWNLTVRHWKILSIESSSYAHFQCKVNAELVHGYELPIRIKKAAM